MVKRNDRETLWSEYRSTRSVELRNQLVEEYLPIAWRFAERFAKHLPRFVSVDDIFSASSLGVIGAVEEFEPTKNVRFETYCRLRMRREVIEQLRDVDSVPRMVRARIQAYNGQQHLLQARLGRTPTHSELMAKLQLSAQQYEDVLREIASARIFSLDAAEEESDEHRQWGGLIELVEKVHVQRSQAPGAEMLARDACLRMLAELTTKEREMLILRHLGSLSHKQIAARYALHQTRVCQIIKHAEAKLRSFLSHRKDDFV